MRLADQESADHYYLKLRGMLSVNRQSSVWSCIWSYVRSCAGKVAIKEEYLKQLHSIKGKKSTNLVCTQRRFNLVVRLIANKYFSGCILLFILSIHDLRLPSSFLSLLLLLI